MRLCGKICCVVACALAPEGSLAAPLCAEDSTVVETPAYYVQALSDVGGHRRMVRTRSKPETYVTFVTVRQSRLEYHYSTDLGKTWQGDRQTVLGPSLQCGISTWVDEEDNIYVLYDDSRNALTVRKLTYEGNARWTTGERGNEGQSMAQYRAYMHSAIVKEPGRDGKLWAAWWEHGRDGEKEGTIKRIHVRRSSDPDGLREWSDPMDPLPADIPAIENESLAVSFLLVDGKPLLFIYQGFYGRTGMSRWNGKEWVFEEIDLKAGLHKNEFAYHTTFSITSDAAGVVHFVWSARAEEGSIFTRQLRDGRWGPTMVLSACPYDRWPTITLTPAGEPVVLWCHPVNEAPLADPKVFYAKADYNIVYRKLRAGRWDAEEKVAVVDEKMQDGVTHQFPNTCMTSGEKIVFIYTCGSTEAGGTRALKSGVMEVP